LKTKTIRIEDEKSGTTTAVYEHPYIVRLCHWANTISLFVLIGSGLQIFRAFPSFGSKVPQTNLIDWPRSLAIGGWLGGALQWHLTFMWIYLATGVIYLGYQLFSGHYRQVLFTHRDFAGVWPMVRRYFFFGPKPQQREAYNALQKQAYTTVVILGVLSVLTGFAIWKPVQLSGLAWVDGRFPLGEAVALLNHDCDSPVHPRPPGDGRATRLAEFRFHAYRVEERSGISFRVKQLQPQL